MNAIKSSLSSTNQWLTFSWICFVLLVIVRMKLFDFYTIKLNEKLLIVKENTCNVYGIARQVVNDDNSYFGNIGLTVTVPNNEYGECDW
jgi:hypothetical protein